MSNLSFSFINQLIMHIKSPYRNKEKSNLVLPPYRNTEKSKLVLPYWKYEILSTGPIHINT